MPFEKQQRSVKSLETRIDDSVAVAPFKSLRRVHLYALVTNVRKGLDSPIKDDVPYDSILTRILHWPLRDAALLLDAPAVRDESWAEGAD